MRTQQHSRMTLRRTGTRTVRSLGATWQHLMVHAHLKIKHSAIVLSDELWRHSQTRCHQEHFIWKMRSAMDRMIWTGRKLNVRRLGSWTMMRVGKAMTVQTMCECNVLRCATASCALPSNA